MADPSCPWGDWDRMFLTTGICLCLVEDLHPLQLGKLTEAVAVAVAAAVVAAVVDVGFAVVVGTAVDADERKCCSTSVDGT